MTQTMLEQPTSPVELSLRSDPAALEAPVVLVDFGSTFTKVRLVDAATGRLVATGQHRTTVDTDVLAGLDATLAALADELPGVDLADVRACSSAGGGLRLAVIGLEAALTGEAARRAALSAGARVVTVLAGGLTSDNSADLLRAQPDIVLLAGGTDGGNRRSLIESAATLARLDLDTPIVVAGNTDAQPEAAAILATAGKHAVRAPNVLPEIGVIDEHHVRLLVRDLFISHVIGGKKLSQRASEFARHVRMATPDAVLQGVETLASGLARRGRAGSVVVVDVGGATTDVHSVVVGETERGYRKSLLPQAGPGRTVEGDLGLRWNAPGILDAAHAEGLLDSPGRDRLRPHAQARADEPALLATTREELAVDLELARLAVLVAVRRHAGRLAVTLTSDGAVLDRRGRDLRDVSTLVGTGGIFAHADETSLRSLLALGTGSGRDDRMLPASPALALDRAYVFAAAGLLAQEHPDAAWRLLTDELIRDQAAEPGEGRP